jgi:hypothetical protein
MQSGTTATVLVLAAMAVGCKKEDAPPSPAPSASAASAASAPKAPANETKPVAGCPAGAMKIADPGFCVTVPAAYKASEKSQSGSEWSMDFADPENRHENSIRVRWTDDKDEIQSNDDRYKRYTDPAKYEVKGKGELLGGKSRWFYSKDKNAWSTIGVYVQGPKYQFICESSTNSDGPSQQKVLDMCKSITPL